MDAIITLTGNLGADPRIRAVGPEQTPVVEFSIAHTPRIREGAQWKDGTTSWYRVTCWRRLAVHTNACLRRGDAVIVTGRLRPTEWIDKDGVVRRSEEIEAITVGPDLSRRMVHLVRDIRSSGAGQETGSEQEGAPEGEAPDTDYLAGHDPELRTEPPEDVGEDDPYATAAA